MNGVLLWCPLRALSWHALDDHCNLDETSMQIVLARLAARLTGHDPKTINIESA